MFSHVLRKHIKLLLFSVIFNFQQLLANSNLIKPIIFFEICNVLIKNIEYTFF